MPCPYTVILGSTGMIEETAMPCPYSFILGSTGMIEETAMPCPYTVILGRDTALPSPDFSY
jgi:hypothetical protein